MRFESQTHPQDDHLDRITDCSTPYGQAPAVCTRVSLAKGRWVNKTTPKRTIYGCWGVLRNQTEVHTAILLYCWASVEDYGSKLEQHWDSVSCLLGRAHSGKQ